jgi:signal transduction histidine kinase
MEPSITIFWIDVAEADASILDRVAGAHHATIVPVEFCSLAARTYAALAQGAVVFVARTEEEATRALGMGVDEIVRAGEVREDALAETLVRARARASARTAYELRRGLFQDDDELSLASLTASFGNQLARPLASAALECEMLEAQLAGVLDVGDEFAECSMERGPVEQARDLAVRRLALAPSKELKRLLADVRVKLRRANAMATTLTSLAAQAPDEPTAPVAKLVADVVGILRPDFAPWATIAIEAEGPCRVSVAPITVVFVLSALLVNALDAVRAAREEGGAIEVRLSEHEDAMVLEVQDDGRPMAPDLRPTVFDAYFDVARTNRTGLVRVRERMRRCGGDLTVDSDASGTTVRVLFPTSSDDVLFEPDTPRVLSARKTQPD